MYKLPKNPNYYLAHQHLPTLPPMQRVLLFNCCFSGSQRKLALAMGHTKGSQVENFEKTDVVKIRFAELDAKVT